MRLAFRLRYGAVQYIGATLFSFHTCL